MPEARRGLRSRVALSRRPGDVLEGLIQDPLDEGPGELVGRLRDEAAPDARTLVGEIPLGELAAHLAPDPADGPPGDVADDLETFVPGEGHEMRVELAPDELLEVLDRARGHGVQISLGGSVARSVLHAGRGTGACRKPSRVA